MHRSALVSYVCISPFLVLFFSLIHHLQQAINKTDVSADIDDAEGCLDALMQVVVCEDVSTTKSSFKTNKLRILNVECLMFIVNISYAILGYFR